MAENPIISADHTLLILPLFLMIRTGLKSSFMVLVMLALSSCISAPTTTPSANTNTKKEETKATVNANTKVSTNVNLNGNTNDTTAGEISIGSQVASKWADGNYWAATVTDISGSTFTVNYDDGTKETNSKENLILLSNKIALKSGDKVLAVWSSNGRFYSGVIEEVKAGSAVVKWDDGSTPSEVVLGKIILQPRQTATPPTSGDIPVGSRVASKWADGNYWAATVTDSTGTTYKVKYDDGTNGTNTIDKLKLLSDTITLEKGDKVLAVWSSNGRFYDGVVQEVKTTSAIIQWDDGSAPSEVVLGKIIKK